MASPLLNAAAVMLCSHGGHCQPTTFSPRVRVSGSPCLTLGSPMAIVGCPNPPNQGGPCTTAQALTGSLRIQSMGQPVLLLGSTLLALPSGQAVFVAGAGQTRVTGA